MASNYEAICEENRESYGTKGAQKSGKLAAVRQANAMTLGAAEKAGRLEEVSGRIREQVAAIPEHRNFVRVVLGEAAGETKQLRH